MKRSLILMMVFILALLLGGCIPISTAEYTIEIQQQEQWAATIEVAAPAQYVDQLSQSLNQIKSSQQIQSSGAQVTVETLPALPNGDVPHRLTIKGQGYQNLCQVIGCSIDVTDANIQRNLRFSLNPYTAIYSSMTPQQTVVTLKGGQIISSNGVQSSNSVTWTNPSEVMQAEMIEPSWWDYLPWILGGIAILGILGLLVLFGLWKMVNKPKSIHQPVQARQTAKHLASKVYPNNQSSSPAQLFDLQHQQPTPSPTQDKLCTQCRERIPVHSVFCPNCGARQSQ